MNYDKLKISIIKKMAALNVELVYIKKKFIFFVLDYQNNHIKYTYYQNFLKKL